MWALGKWRIATGREPTWSWWQWDRAMASTSSTGNGGIERQAGAAFAFGMGAGVHEEAVAVHFHQPGAGANIGVGIEVNDAHGGMLGAIMAVGNRRGNGEKGSVKINLNIFRCCGVIYYEF